MKYLGVKREYLKFFSPQYSFRFRDKREICSEATAYCAEIPIFKDFWDY